MRLGHRARWATGAARLCAVSAAALMLVPAVTQIAAGPPVAEHAGWAGTAMPRPAATPAKTVLLINGDRVLIASGPSGQGTAAVIPAAPGGLTGSALGLDIADRAFEIPTAALPYLGRGLSPELFELNTLQRLETGGRLPVRVTYHRHLPALPGVSITAPAAAPPSDT